jgi:diguanylate cyclase (GGDEF)-like protein
MSGAGFILTINLFVAALFALAFFLVAMANASNRVAVWFGLAYLSGLGFIVFEFLLPFQTDPKVAGYLAFASFLMAMALVCVGIARRYRVRVPWQVLAAIVLIALASNWVAFDLDRGSLVRQYAYQAPYAALQFLCVVVVLNSRRRQPLDIGLLVLFVLGAVQFLSKPIVAQLTGGPGSTAQEYIATDYALYSQTLGAVLSIATGLLMLTVLVRDMLVDVTERSETDMLSGLYNRRGFEARAEPGLQAAQRGAVPAALIACDLDHFKSVNDSFGHEAGDRVIRAFATLVRRTAPERAISARIGGEEFAIFIPGANQQAGQLYAEAVRASFAATRVEGLPDGTRFTASFGVAECHDADSLSELRRRADSALYAAKRNGRDRVAVAGSPDAMPDHPLGLAPPLRRRQGRA